MSVAGLLQQLVAPFIGGAAASKGNFAEAASNDGAQGFNALFSQQLQGLNEDLPSTEAIGNSATDSETNEDEGAFLQSDAITLGISNEPLLLPQLIAPAPLSPLVQINTTDTPQPNTTLTDDLVEISSEQTTPGTAITILTTPQGLLDYTKAMGIMGTSYTTPATLGASPYDPQYGAMNPLAALNGETPLSDQGEMIPSDPALPSDSALVDPPIIPSKLAKTEKAEPTELTLITVENPSTEDLSGISSFMFSDINKDSNNKDADTHTLEDDVNTDLVNTRAATEPNTGSLVADFSTFTQPHTIQPQNSLLQVAIPNAAIQPSTLAEPLPMASSTNNNTLTMQAVGPTTSANIQPTEFSTPTTPKAHNLATVSQPTPQPFEQVMAKAGSDETFTGVLLEASQDKEIGQPTESFHQRTEQKTPPPLLEGMTAATANTLQSGQSNGSSLSSVTPSIASVAVAGSVNYLEQNETTTFTINEALPEEALSALNQAETTGSVPLQGSFANGIEASTDSVSTPNTDNVVGQVVDGAVQAHLENPTTTKPTQVSLILNPEHLGSVRVQLTAHPNSGPDGGAIQARFIVTTPEAQALLTQQLDTLSQRLESQNIRLDRIQIVLAPEGVTPSQSSSNSTGSGLFQSNDSSPQSGQSGWNQNNQQGPSYQEQADRQQWFQQLAGGFNGQGQSNTHGNGRSLYATAPVSPASSYIPRTEGAQMAQSPPSSGVDHRIASGTTKISLLI